MGRLRKDRLRDRPPNKADRDLARIVDQLTELVRLGVQINWSQCARQHPRHAEALKELAPAIKMLANYRETCGERHH